MTYQETLDFMFAQLPMYHRVGAAAYKADIQPTINMMAALGNPERKFRSIHVAGTNGKGSVSHMLASILQEAGYKVGLYTSPHLVDFRERIRINGEMIPHQAVVDFVDDNRQLFADLSLSFFEMTVGMAFDYFAKEKVDIAVVEVGMGGRLDSTNVIKPELSIITNIGLDHTQFLGDTLEKIAGEKAGIIKDGVPVVIGETQAETWPVFNAVAQQHNAPITYADQHYFINDECGMLSDELMVFTVQGPHSSLLTNEEYGMRNDELNDEANTPSLHTPHSTLTSQLTGEYQKKNIATVLEAVEVLRRNPSFNIPHSALINGLARVVTNTHLHGRWQTVGTAPLTICETAHNEPGIRAMIGKLETMRFGCLHLIYGCVNDKDYIHILKLLNSSLSSLGSQLTWYFSQPSVPRALPVGELSAAASECGINGTSYENVKEAIAAARSAAADDDLVLITGSIFLVADALTE